MAKVDVKRYTSQELSAFCLQISLLLKAAIPMEEGLSVMAEDAADDRERKNLLWMSDEVELGKPFSVVLEEAGTFPAYVVKMAKLGEETGTLDQMMASLAEYYEKEHFLMKNIKNAVTYPIIMIFMLLVVLFVLFTEVMPIFERVYKQLGAEMSPVSIAATRLGGAFSGAAIVVGVLLLAASGVIWIMGKSGHKVSWLKALAEMVKRRSRIALAISNRRFASVLALSLKSGLDLDKGLSLAEELVENPAVEGKIRECGAHLEAGMDYYSAMKETGLFGGFYVQMIKVGVRSGRLDQVMEEIARGYEEEADTATEQMVNRLEPTMVAVLAVAVGLILLSVMLPLAGVLSAIG